YLAYVRKCSRHPWRRYTVSFVTGQSIPGLALTGGLIHWINPCVRLARLSYLAFNNQTFAFFNALAAQNQRFRAFATLGISIGYPVSTRRAVT
ncbi:MAG: hypothetical protein V3S33_05630, partial [Gammaproteobacteria bacterium]